MARFTLPPATAVAIFLYVAPQATVSGPSDDPLDSTQTGAEIQPQSLSANSFFSQRPTPKALLRDRVRFQTVHVEKTLRSGTSGFVSELKFFGDQLDPRVRHRSPFQ